MKAIILHGTMGSSEGNWFPWLKRELESRGVEVAVPRLPTPEGQSLDSWMRVLSEYSAWFGDELVIVAHSASPAVVLNALQKHKAFAAFLVCPFLSAIGNGEYDTLNASFYNERLDWLAIKKNCKHFFVYAGSDDPYVPLEKCEFVAKKLGVEVNVVKGGKHLNAEAGYTKFPRLLEDLIGVLKSELTRRQC